MAPIIGRFLTHLGQREYRAYLWRSALGWLNRRRFRCPACGARDSTPVARKLLVTALVRCGECKILYRVPTDPPQFADRLYQEAYDAGYYSDLPAPDCLAQLVARGFAGTERDHRRYVELLGALGVEPGMRVFEFGASWGYGTWQLLAAGYTVTGYELSKPRARYAREMLGLPVEDDLEKVAGGFDVFFSSHVLEHLPAPQQAFQLAHRLLKREGLFVAVTPNGSTERRRSDFGGFQQDWGMYHPIFLDEEFYQRQFAERPLLLASSPFPLERLRSWNRQEPLILPLIGPELLFAIAASRL